MDDHDEEIPLKHPDPLKSQKRAYRSGPLGLVFQPQEFLVNGLEEKKPEDHEFFEKGTGKNELFTPYDPFDCESAVYKIKPKATSTYNKINPTSETAPVSAAFKPPGQVGVMVGRHSHGRIVPDRSVQFTARGFIHLGEEWVLSERVARLEEAENAQKCNPNNIQKQLQHPPSVSSPFIKPQDRGYDVNENSELYSIQRAFGFEDSIPPQALAQIRPPVFVDRRIPDYKKLRRPGGHVE